MSDRAGDHPTLNPVTEAFVEALTKIADVVVCSDTDRYLEEPRGMFTGRGQVMAPRNTEAVAAVIRACAKARIGVVPYGGGTGLVGGQVKPDGPAPLVLSLERMSRIRECHRQESLLTVEAGVILADVQAAAAEMGRLFPLSLASEGSARIGGLLSTNAGGVNVLRYGNARTQVLGIEAVTGEGQIWRGLTRLYKDNTGYDLRDLFIGAEGTLGVITAATLRLAPRPAAHGVALLEVRDPAAALTLLELAQSRLGPVISAFELIDGQGLRFLKETGLMPHLPFETIPDWSVLIDIGTSGEGAQPALEGLFESGEEAGLVRDGVIASSEAQAQKLWALRETIPLANRRIGAVSSHDISLPLSELPDFITEAGQAITEIGPFRINCFGHLGDGNLHYNVFPKSGEINDLSGLRDAVAETVYRIVHARGGSFSAEHGVGRLKLKELAQFGDPVKLALMRRIKEVFDPHGIMNPGAVLEAGIADCAVGDKDERVRYK